MTAQEQQMIDGLISRVRNTVVGNKDSAAEQRLQQGLGGNPDALYVLAQTVLVQQYGLQQAQSRLRELQQQKDALEQQLQSGQHAGGSGGGFLSHIFGGGSSSAAQPASPSYQPVNNPGFPPPQAYPGGSVGGGYAPVSYPQGGAMGAPMGGGFGGGGGGFLQGALQTAAGVAAGEMMFQGMESLVHGFEHSGGGGSERGFLNDASTGTGRDDSSFYNPSDDASRQDLGSGSDDRGFADSNDLGSGDLGSGNDATFDSGSDFDSGGGDGFTGTDDGGF